ncbi:hypothetical protein COCNU_16G000080 [Cocos nucifera]|uniref:Uncharacterized protein n=1 Tax=Cocos nucifera TaxID=13894 RepID=A0A8K0IXQ4_COCNU|nr:hypothetical protein COCNU_16G000080 [Cocos nucifera]
MKMVLEDDDLKQVQREYRISEGVVLEVPSLVNRVTSCQENQIAIYEKVLRASLRLLLPEVFADLLGWGTSANKDVPGTLSSEGVSSKLELMSQFFFVSSLTLWGFLTGWGTSMKPVLLGWGTSMKPVLLDLPGLTETEKAVVEELKQLKAPPYPKLLCENLLKAFSWEELASAGPLKKKCKKGRRGRGSSYLSLKAVAVAIAITGPKVAKPKATTTRAEVVGFEAIGLVVIEPIASGPKAFEVVDKQKEKWSKKHVVPLSGVTMTSITDAAFIEDGMIGGVLLIEAGIDAQPIEAKPLPGASGVQLVDVEAQAEVIESFFEPSLGMLDFGATPLDAVEIAVQGTMVEASPIIVVEVFGVMAVMSWATEDQLI